jgi:D-amino peptidase
MEGIDRSPDVVAFIGYHTGAGQQGVLAHTYMGNTITGVRINDELASEGRMNALLAAEYGVPVVLVTGDDLTCADAQKYAPTAVGVAVKTCVDRYSAICLPPTVSAASITDGAARALGAPRQLSTTAADGYTYEVSFDAAHLAPLVTYIPGVEQVDDLTVRFTLPTMYEAIRCFRAVTRLAGTGVERTYG